MSERLRQVSIALWGLLILFAVATHAIHTVFTVWICGAVLTTAWAFLALSTLAGPIQTNPIALVGRHFWLCLVPLAIAALGALQLFLGTTRTPWFTTQYALAWTWAAGTAALTGLLFRTPDSQARTIRVLILAGAFLTMLAILQSIVAPGKLWFLWDSGIPATTYSPFLNHSKFANFLELLLAPAIVEAVWAFRAGGWRRAAVWVAAACIFWAAAPASASRGGSLFLTFEALLVLWLLRRRTPDLYSGWNWRYSTFGITAALVGVGWLLGAGALLDRLRTLQFFEDGRPVIFAIAWDTARNAPPLLGSGLGSWQLVHLAYARFDATLFVNQAHCDWLQWWIEGGIVLIGLVLALFWSGIRAAIRDPRLAGLPILFLHATIDFPFQQTPNLTLFYFVWFALAWSSLDQKPTEPSRSGSQ